MAHTPSTEIELRDRATRRGLLRAPAKASYVAIVAAISFGAGGCGTGGVTLFAQVFLLLVAVSFGAALWLRFAARRGWIGRTAKDAPLEVLARVGLGPRSELIAARVVDHVVVLAITPAGVTRVDRVPLSTFSGRSFAAVLAQTAQHPGTAADPAKSRDAGAAAEDDDELVC